jgi:uncharacterized OB-fold protein
MAAIPERLIPAPIPTEDTLAFWTAAREGNFLIKRCLDCGEVHWYPRALCPFCFSERTEWQPGSGWGSIYSFTVMRRAPQPYAQAFVTLAEGPTMLTNLVDCDFDALAIGQAVQVVFKPSDGDWLVPVFTPAQAPAA